MKQDPIDPAALLEDLELYRNQCRDAQVSEPDRGVMMSYLDDADTAWRSAAADSSQYAAVARAIQAGRAHWQSVSDTAVLPGTVAIWSASAKRAVRAPAGHRVSGPWAIGAVAIVLLAIASALFLRHRGPSDGSAASLATSPSALVVNSPTNPGPIYISDGSGDGSRKGLLEAAGLPLDYRLDVGEVPVAQMPARSAGWDVPLSNGYVAFPGSATNRPWDKRSIGKNLSLCMHGHARSYKLTAAPCPIPEIMLIYASYERYCSNRTTLSQAGRCQSPNRRHRARSPAHCRR